MSSEKPNVIPLKGRKCPICGRSAVSRYRPFCSGRCADQDLGNWLKGDYRIATNEQAEQDEGQEES